MSQPNAPIAPTELRAALRDLDARGERPSGLVMSPETWAMLADDVEPSDRADARYAGVPVWVRTDCEGVELVRPAPSSAAPQEDVAWI